MRLVFLLLLLLLLINEEVSGNMTQLADDGLPTAYDSQRSAQTTTFLLLFNKLSMQVLH
jgi:hypothetical protein